MIDLATELYTDEYFMREAFIEAEKAFDAGEVPVGAVIVWKNRVIGRGHNLTETLNDPTAHAEIQAITAATNTIGGKYLTECILYVTLEPCVMCAGACFWAQIGTIVYGAGDEKRGYSLVGQNILHPKTRVIKGILREKSTELLKTFFRSVRR
ncbi:MAG: nucleoside deaminase [Prevotellaceae bacterium]|jgi:tRNA(adenine34) deaminase|nr:nucleoside deaminase [Prevotellaceae bacterium]